MGKATPENPGYIRGAYIRPVLLVYSLLGSTGTAYTCVTEKNQLARVNNWATLLLHVGIFAGVFTNTEFSLRLTKRYIKFFIILYTLVFFALPVMVSSYRASGSMSNEQPKLLIESVGCLFKKEHDQAEFDRQLDIHTKDQIFKVFVGNVTKARVEHMFENQETRKYILMIPDHVDFKTMISQKFTVNGFGADKIFDSLYKDVKNHEMFKSGMLSGYGMELACLLTIGLIYMQYSLVKRLWIHSIKQMTMMDQYLHF